MQFALELGQSKKSLFNLIHIRQVFHWRGTAQAPAQVEQLLAERGNGVWVLESDLGAVSQVRRLDQAADEMREALAYLAGLPEEEVEVEVVPVLPTAWEASKLVAPAPHPMSMTVSPGCGAADETARRP